uniref:CD36 family protein n=1 Tax=Phaeomonas parva TaxID=124430 RepID=A0A6U4JUK2_9STRA|mmetsp:Transcript_42726/g.133904  ORF Transcript_42726/g.133904 Transcript_42726/m.133904 type:complete len:698 (+) Transcript_42726:619-2712(+)
MAQREGEGATAEREDGVRVWGCVQAAPCCRVRCWRLERIPDALAAVLFILSIAALLLGAVIRPVVNDALYAILDQQTVVDSKDAPAYDTWVSNFPGVDNAVPVTYAVSVFDLTNPEEVLLGTEKPKLVERGPYTYNYYYRRLDVSWRDGDDDSGDQIISFTEQDIYLFDKNASFPGANDVADTVMQSNFASAGARNLLQAGGAPIHEAIIDAINGTALPEAVKATLIGLLDSAHGWQALYKAILCSSPQGHFAGDVNDDAMSLAGEITPFWTRSVRDLWFGYFDDPTLEVLKVLFTEFLPNEPFFTYVPGIAYNATSQEDTLARFSPDAHYTGKRRGTRAVARSKINTFERWMNSSQIWICHAATEDELVLADGTKTTTAPYCPHFQAEWNATQAEAAGYLQPWATDSANSVIGTDGTLNGHPMYDEQLYIYINDIFRSVYLTHSDDVDFHGIDLRRFTIDKEVMGNAEQDPDNAQFYSFGAYGLLNFTKALGFPSSASKPHFLDADPNLQCYVDGLRPVREIHDTALDVEPHSGLAMQGTERLQLAVNHEPIRYANISSLEAEALHLFFGLFDLTPTDACIEKDTPWNFTAGVGYGDLGLTLQLPYGWTSKEFASTEESANQFKDGVYGILHLADALEFWAYVFCIGLCAAAILVVYIQSVARREIVAEDDEGERPSRLSYASARHSYDSAPMEAP